MRASQAKPEIGPQFDTLANTPDIHTMHSPNYVAVADPFKDLYREKKENSIVRGSVTAKGAREKERSQEKKKKKKKTMSDKTDVFGLVWACLGRVWLFVDFYEIQYDNDDDDDSRFGVRAPA